MNIKEAKKIIGNKIIGITCHNSIKIAKEAIKIKLITLRLVLFFQQKQKKLNIKLI